MAHSYCCRSRLRSKVINCALVDDPSIEEIEGWFRTMMKKVNDLQQKAATDLPERTFYEELASLIPSSS